MLKKLLTVLTGLLLVVSFLSACSRSATQPVELKPSSTGQPSLTAEPTQTKRTDNKKAPDFEAITIKGERISLSSLKGKPVILNFWATWCGPCRNEIPELNSFYEEHKDRVILLGIEITESREELDQFLQSQDILFPIILDSEQESSISNLYQVSLIPTTYIIDEQGKIITVIKGSTAKEVLSSYLP